MLESFCPASEKPSCLSSSPACIINNNVACIVKLGALHHNFPVPCITNKWKHRRWEVSVPHA